MRSDVSAAWIDFSASTERVKQLTSIRRQLEQCFSKHLSPITASTVVQLVAKKLGLSLEELDGVCSSALLPVIDHLLSLYLGADDKDRALSDVRQTLRGQEGAAATPVAFSVIINSEADVTIVRGTALQLALRIGFDKPDSVKVSTVVSELARNILQHARTGVIELRALTSPRLALQVTATDEGPGIPNLDQIMAGRYRSRTGMGLGLVGSKRLMDVFSITTAPNQGTKIIGVKYA
jgi:serine/threonine-protein kinase RsbT